MRETRVYGKNKPRTLVVEIADCRESIPDNIGGGCSPFGSVNIWIITMIIELGCLS